MEPDTGQYILLAALRSAVQRHCFPGVTSIEQLVGKLGTVHVVRHGETPANVEKRINPPAWRLSDPHLCPTQFTSPSSYLCSAEQPYYYPDTGHAGLTEKGRQQAESAAEQLLNHPQRPTHIHVSPQERAYETGRAIAKKLAISVLEVEPGLREREFGPYAGIPIKDVAALCERRNAECKDPAFSRDELIGAMNETGEVTAHWFNQTPKHAGEESGETWPETRDRMTSALVSILIRNHGKPAAIATHGDAARMLVAAVRGAPWREVLAHQNDYVRDIQNGQVLTFDMDAMLRDLLEREKANRYLSGNASSSSLSR